MGHIFSRKCWDINQEFLVPKLIHLLPYSSHSESSVVVLVTVKAQKNSQVYFFFKDSIRGIKTLEYSKTKKISLLLQLYEITKVKADHY